MPAATRPPTDTDVAGQPRCWPSRAVMRMSPVAVIVDPSVTPAYTVFWMVTASERSRPRGAAGQADGDVVDAGAFFRAHLHGLRRHRAPRMRARTPFRCRPRRPRRRYAEAPCGGDAHAPVAVTMRLLSWPRPRRVRHRAVAVLPAAAPLLSMTACTSVRDRFADARAAQGLAARAGHGDAEHAVGQAWPCVSARRCPAKSCRRRCRALSTTLRSVTPPSRWSRPAGWQCRLGVLQRGGQLIAVAAVLGHIDDVVTLVVHQAGDGRALALIDHQVAGGQPRRRWPGPGCSRPDCAHCPRWRSASRPGPGPG